MKVEEITYEVDGRRLVGWWAVDDEQAGARPGVLLAHEGPGLDDHVRGRAERLAAMGYAAFALDYHGGGETLEPDAFITRLGELTADTDQMRRLGAAGLDVLLSRPEVDRERVAVVGFCFGGVIAMEPACTGADLRAVVGFHPGFTSPRPEDTAKVNGSILMCCGSEDPIISTEDRRGFEQELRDAAVTDWQVLLFGGVGHSFTNKQADALGIPGIGYDAVADRRSWDAMLGLFADVLN